MSTKTIDLKFLNPWISLFVFMRILHAQKLRKYKIKRTPNLVKHVLFKSKLYSLRKIALSCYAPIIYCLTLLYEKNIHDSIFMYVQSGRDVHQQYGSFFLHASLLVLGVFYWTLFIYFNECQSCCQREFKSAAAEMEQI